MEYNPHLKMKGVGWAFTGYRRRKTVRDIKQEEQQNTKHEMEMDSLIELLEVHPQSDWLPAGLLITNINIKKRFTGSMIMIKALKKGVGPVIAFRTTLDVIAACHAFRRDIAAGTQKWKRDKWGEQKVDDTEES